MLAGAWQASASINRLGGQFVPGGDVAPTFGAGAGRLAARFLVESSQCSNIRPVLNSFGPGLDLGQNILDYFKDAG